MGATLPTLESYPSLLPGELPAEFEAFAASNPEDHVLRTRILSRSLEIKEVALRFFDDLHRLAKDHPDLVDATLVHCAKAELILAFLASSRAVYPDGRMVLPGDERYGRSAA